jgi:Ca2+-binding RTX toxin-like protein
VISALTSYTLGAELENLQLAAGDDDLNGTGNELDNEISGNAGGNLLAGAGGSDTLVGGAGNDTLDSGSGVDSLVGGEGDDVYVLAAVPPPGILVELSGNGFILDGERTLSSVNGSFNVDLFDFTLDGLVDTVRVIHTAPGPVLWMLQFSTRQLGHNLVPGVYEDAERYPFETSGHPGLDVSGESHGSNTVTGEFTVHFADFDYSAGAAVELLKITFEHHRDGLPEFVIGTLSINFSDDALPDAIVELEDGGIDTVQSGNDHALAANVENLVLTGSADIGGTGNELDNEITGNAGDNALTGGDGNDRFVFSTSGDVDAIADFSAGDRIVLDDAVYSALSAGALAADAFLAGDGFAAAADAAQRIVYDTETGELYYDADGVGGAGAVKFATLSGAPALAATDFEVV